MVQPTTEKWPPPWWPWLRNFALLLGGMASFAYQLTAYQAERPFSLAVSVAMMGLPAFLGGRANGNGGAQ